MRIRNKKDPRRIQMRDFECSVCGTRRTATKRLGRTHEGHIKTMYCVTCREVTDHVQL